MSTTTSTTAVRATLPRTVADKPTVHLPVAGIGTASATFTTTALTGADAAQDINNATFVAVIAEILTALKTLGLIEVVSQA